MRAVVLALLILAVSDVFGANRGEWYEVAGGAWEPDAAVLSAAKVRTRERWVKYCSQCRGISWGDYSFQYQGVAKEARRLVHVNAFCIDVMKEFHKPFDYSHDWLRAFGGGPCFFRADYDPMTDVIATFEANGPK